MTVTDEGYPNVALMIITDGRRDYLTRTVQSFHDNCDFPFTTAVMWDDSKDRRGLAGAIQAGWDQLPDGTEFVFHLEDDFVFPETIPVRQMLSALRAYPNLAQVALKRQPWSHDEQLAGNMLALVPGLTQVDGLCFHRNLFTFNPCLYPIEVTRYGAGLEREVTDKLLADDWQFAYYGGKYDDPRCIHIGERRSNGYRW